MKNIYTFLFLSLFTITFANAQQTAVIMDWQKCIGGTADDEAKCIKETNDGGFIIAGSTTSNDGDISGNHGGSDFLIVKTNSEGTIEWQKCYGGTLDDNANSILQTDDGGYIIAGTTKSNDGDVSGNNGGSDYWIVKINIDGTIEWQKCFGSSSNETANTIQTTFDGGYIISGTFILKIDNFSNKIWQTNYNLFSIQQTIDSGFIALNNTTLFKLNSLGLLEWQNDFGSIYDDEISNVIETNEENFVFIKNTYDNTWFDPIDMGKTINIIDKTGKFIFSKEISADNYFYYFLKYIVKQKDGGYIIAGDDYERAIIVKTDSLFNKKWSRSYGTNSWDNYNFLNSIICSKEGHIIFTKRTEANDGDVSGNHGGADAWIVKLREIIPNEIKGTIFSDANSNCTKDSLEIPLKNVIIKTEPGNFYTNSNELGEYTLLTDTGFYKIKQIVPQNIAPLFSGLNCPSSDFYSVNFPKSGIDTCCFNFANQVNECYVLSVNVSSNRRRRCFNNNTSIEYCNNGLALANNVEVFVEFPEYLNLVKANKMFTNIGKNIYRFDIGTLQAGECGSINITDSVSCENGIMGITQCTKAWILPLNDCLHNLQDTSTVWDKSIITVNGNCLNDSIANFVIKNTAETMQNTSECRIFVDGILAKTETFQLLANDSLVLPIIAKGNTIFVEVDQTQGNPFSKLSSDFVEACGLNSEGKFSTSYVIQQLKSSEDISISESCLEILDKQVSPSGITANHFVKPETKFDFVIRFQNTGNDTAYKVIVIDTLSADLDISTLEFGASSHKYSTKVSGQNHPILEFTFNNINLTDSTTNEAESHGFIQFSIAAKKDLAMKTVISNFADIYFDYNLPIRTNTAWVTISDTTLTGASVIILDVQKIAIENTKFEIYPNPAKDEVFIEIVAKGISQKAKGFMIYSIDGKEVKKGKLENTKTRISTKDLENGIYFIEIGKEVRKFVKK